MRILGLLWLCWMSLRLSIAQTPYWKIHNLFKKGQKINTFVIFKSSSGVMFFGTDMGLFRYNSHSFRRFTTENGLPSNNITAISEWKGEIWLGHKEGYLTVMSTNGSFTQHQPREGVPESPVKKLLPLNDSILLMATYGEGLHFYNRFSHRQYIVDLDDGLGDNNCYDIELLSENRVLVGTDGGMNVVKLLPHGRREVSTVNMGESLRGAIITSLTAIENQQFLVGTYEHGLWVFDANTLQLRPLVENLEMGAIQDAIALEGQIWIATREKGIWIWDTSLATLKPIENFPSQKVNCLLPTADGDVWIGTNDKLFQSSGNRLNFIRLNENVLALCYQPATQTLFYSTEEGLFGRHVPSRKTKLYSKAGKNAVSLFADRYGLIWIGSLENGLARFDPKTGNIAQFASQPQLKKLPVASISGDNDYIWLATFEGAFRCRLLGNGLEQMTPFEPLGNESAKTNIGQYLYYILSDHLGRTVFCTSGKGLAVMEKNGQIVSYRDSIPTQDILNVVVDKQGNLWVGSDQKGVFRFDGKSFSRVRHIENPEELGIYALAVDDRGRILAARKNALELIAPQSLHTAFFEKEDGIENTEFNTNAIASDAGRFIWLGTSNGIIQYRSIAAERPTLPKVVINKTQVYLKDFDPGPEHIFGPNQNHLTFDFVAYWYHAPDRITYQYQIEGYDIDWNTTNKTTATYAGLPPGTYTFKVRASTGDFYDDLPVTEYRFTVRSPLWQRWWFVALMSLTLVGLVVALIRLRTRNLEKAKQELEAKVLERTAEILAQNEEIAIQRDKIQEAMQQIEIKTRDLEAAFILIEKKNRDITGSINYAQRIQNAFLPTPAQLSKAFGEEYFVIFRPRDIVSGDFYWLQQNEATGEIYVAAVDCTGHGVPGAFMSLIGNSLLNAIFSKTPCANPQYILEQLDQGVRDFLKQDENKTRDGMDAAICKINPHKKRVKFASARRPIYFHRPGLGLIQIPGDSKSVGGFSESQTFEGYKLHEFPYEPGEVVYLFSDGIPDQFGGPEGKKYMIRRFREFIQSIVHLPMPEQGRIIEQEITHWQGSYPQTDDWLVLGFRLGQLEVVSG